MKKAIIILLVLAAAAFGVYRSGLFKKEDPNVMRLSGNIELTTVDLSFRVPGRLVKLSFREGDKVKAGEVVAQLDRDVQEETRNQQEAGVAAAQAALTQAQTAVQYQQTQVENEVQLRRAELRAAEAQLNDLLAGSRPQEVAQSTAAVADARAWHNQAADDFERAKKLVANEDISKAQFDQYRTRFESTRQTLRQAEERLALVKEGPRKQAIEAARAQVERARSAIEVAEGNRIEIKRRQQELDLRRAEIQRARAGVAVVDAQIADTVLKSPIDGTVLVKSAEQGEVLAAGAIIATLGDIEHPWLRGYVAEKNLGRIKIGTKVKLTTDSYPGKVYWGEVTFIASEAEFTPKQIQTPDERTKLVYRIKVEVPNPNQELKANMPVDAEIAL